MTYKDLETSRNRRLWITQVVLPVATIATSVLIAVPEARVTLVNKTVQVTNSIKEKFNKKESENKTKTIISINAKDRQEALKALELLVKQVMESTEDNQPINKRVRMKG